MYGDPAIGIKATRAESPAAKLADQLQYRTKTLANLIDQLDRIYTTLHGPRPEPIAGDSPKMPPAGGFFEAIERQVEEQSRLLERGEQRATQILDALAL